MIRYAFLASSILSLSSFAQSIEGSSLTQIDTEEGSKTISLQILSPVEFYSKMEADAEMDYSKGIVSFDRSPSAVFKVPSVPILDQGAYGTCVTFATTAALDASLGIGDDISQQCSLELVKAVKEDLWDGAWMSSQFIDPLKQYGAVKQGRCGPHRYPDPNASVTLEEYKKLIDPSILISKVQYVYHEPMSVEQVKVAVFSGHYVSFGFGLLNDGSAVSVQGFNVSVNGSKKVGGLWACKQPGDAKNYCGKYKAGHEVVIVGYDDAQQLFKIQNSWNVSSGDSGFYYMSYPFFRAMDLNATEIWAQ